VDCIDANKPKTTARKTPAARRTDKSTGKKPAKVVEGPEEPEDEDGDNEDPEEGEGDEDDHTDDEDLEAVEWETDTDDEDDHTDDEKGRVLPKTKGAYLEALGTAVRSNNCLGSMLVIGIVNEDSDEDSDEDNEYNEEQIASLRYILINDARDKALKHGHYFASCGQCEKQYSTWYKSDGRKLIFGIPSEVKTAMAKKTIPERFDALFALTHGLQQFDFWMNRWEEADAMGKAINGIAVAWAGLLKCSNTELGIDAEYTRPGINALLGEFGDAVEMLDAVDCQFKWQ
jgi:hypothetical protein